MCNKIRSLIIMCFGLTLLACASNQHDLGNQLPNTQSVPLDKTMPPQSHSVEMN